MSEYNLTEKTDEHLDNAVRADCGSKVPAGYLWAMHINVQRSRIRESLARVDMFGIAARQRRTVHHRVYNDSCPLALWHLDGNHNLIRWHFVVHGPITSKMR